MKKKKVTVALLPSPSTLEEEEGDAIAFFVVM